MSTIKHPVGPQSNKVYWRRRLVVLLGLLAVIVVIVLIVVGPGRSAEAEKPASDPGSSAAPSTGQTPTATGAGGACAPGSVSVEAVTDEGDYAADQEPALSLVVTNTGPAACSLNVGTAAQVFTIKSGSDVYWTSTDCQTDSSNVPFELQPGVPVKSSAPIVWDRTRSDPGTCDSGERESAPAEGASYHLTVTVDGVTSTTSKQFILN
ncbi:hypothetical protein [Microterricola viridarii]|uniref:DUF4232 domain-containing protein n=1 Tax=Microterricola viridarii TaxID=412690 RepID=A0A109QWF7_9MICO|nr:hypothetical protein [Microterricola viridarii]AMB57589.1 hypothetical protein AWU67_00490 [Microterricola viridarii]